MNGVTFFYSPDDEPDELVDFEELPQVVQTHVDFHIPYEDSTNRTQMNAGVTRATRYQLHGTPSSGDTVFEIGPLTIDASGNGGWAIDSNIDLTAPNIPYPSLTSGQNTQLLKCGEFHADRYRIHTSPADGTNIFQIGPLSITKMVGGWSVTSSADISAPNIDTHAAHVTSHIDFENLGNTEPLYAGAITGTNFKLQGDIATGEKYLDIGPFSITKPVSGPVTVTSTSDITAPNITAMQTAVDNSVDWASSNNLEDLYIPRASKFQKALIISTLVGFQLQRESVATVSPVSGP